MYTSRYFDAVYALHQNHGYTEEFAGMLITDLSLSFTCKISQYTRNNLVNLLYLIVSIVFSESVFFITAFKRRFAMENSYNVLTLTPK